MKEKYVVRQGEKILGAYESYSEAKKAKLKLEARDFINDEYEKDKYTMYYQRIDN